MSELITDAMVETAARAMDHAYNPERLRDCVEDEEPAWGAAEALVDATDALAQEVAR